MLCYSYFGASIHYYKQLSTHYMPHSVNSSGKLEVLLQTWLTLQAISSICLKNLGNVFGFWGTFCCIFFCNKMLASVNGVLCMYPGQIPY